ncbi:serine O-acetyltransferase [Hoyosella rhizosphaerae]|uniref:Serine acetyltransferase n=1 Tax=Hoyosella rhizosphaerae TaxID=1755582 RepID=A0A916UCA9_9ACTN|nr:hypothetical protein [Hoyosella rhizosphaerae]MBN4925894.1 serine O-acetyltransferase [Hoyosella rhizosphaerae]GGC67132.1 hypothetical protein GCM10011410_19740 [Hoyosella rhizosphaerae]
MAEFGYYVARDLQRHADGHRITPLKALTLLAANPGARAALLLRLQENSPLSRWVGWRKIIRQVTLLLTGADFVPGCLIGPGLLMQHPNGIVISGRAVIGDDATILQQVTVGETIGADAQAPRAPTIGARALLSAGARILGDIELGDDVVVGANAVVLISVETGGVAVGVPARVVKNRLTAE